MSRAEDVSIAPFFAPYNCLNKKSAVNISINSLMSEKFVSPYYIKASSGLFPAYRDNNWYSSHLAIFDNRISE